MVGCIQVGRCTPLVTKSIGTSGVGTPGKSGFHISRATSPCRNETALVLREHLRASGEKPMGSLGEPSSTRVSAASSARSMPISSTV